MKYNMNGFGRFLTSNQFFIISLLFSLFPFYLLSIYNHPAAFDDFQMAVLTLKKGNWAFAKYSYNGWSGRYTATVIWAYLNPLLNNSWRVDVKLVPVVALSLFVLSVFFFFRALLGTNSLNRIFLITLCLVSLYLFAIPNVADLFYWFTGAAVYPFGISAFLFSIGCIIILFKNQNSFYKNLYLILSIILVVTAIGTNESLLLAILILSILSLIASIIINSKAKIYFLLLLIFVSIAAYASIAAPGNAVRTSIIYGEGNSISLTAFVVSVAKAVYFTFVNAVGWMNNFALIIASLLFIPSALTLISQNLWLKKVTSIHPLLSLLITIVFLSVQAFPSYLGAGDVDPRVWSSIYFFFLLCWFFNVLVLLNFFRPRVEQVDFSKLAPLKPVLVFILLFSAQGNINQAYLDLFTRAPQYSAHLEERYKRILASKGKDLVVPPIFERLYKYPKTIYVMDITTNAKDGRNTRMSEYFGLKSIRLSKEPAR
jgi:hypothetical protein